MIIDKNTERLHQDKIAKKEIKKKNDINEHGYPEKNRKIKSKNEITKFIKNEIQGEVYNDTDDDVEIEESHGNEDLGIYLSLECNGALNGYDSDESDSEYSSASQLTLELSDIDWPEEDQVSQTTTIIHESEEDLDDNSERASQSSTEESVVNSNKFFKGNFNKLDEERYQKALSEQLQFSDEFPTKHRKEFHAKFSNNMFFKRNDVALKQPEHKSNLLKNVK